MRYFILSILILTTLTVFCQTTNNAKDTAFYYHYAQVQNALYKIANAGISQQNKREKIYFTIADFVTKHPTEEINFSIVAAAVNLSALQIDTLVALIDTSLNKSAYKANALITRRRLTVTETGKQFPSLALTDTLGKQTLVEDYKGKIVLIDFWSSWCMPCRQQIPALKEIYKKYKNKDFEIVGISLDKDKTAWLNAIKNDNQNWLQFCELKGWPQDKIARYLNIYSIPSNFLIDKNGIILGQDLSPEQISYIIASQK
ncbi:MAG: TlpA family protein disulfide reductase [Ferruginibacter sp.]|nr:TlpA family protein disulfide reductase [Ferruginibacter sp.]